MISLLRTLIRGINYTTLALIILVCFLQSDATLLMSMSIDAGRRHFVKVPRSYFEKHSFRVTYLVGLEAKEVPYVLPTDSLCVLMV